MITAGQGPWPTGMLSAAGQIPSTVSISTERCVTATPFVVLVVVGPYLQRRPRRWAQGGFRRGPGHPDEKSELAACDLPCPQSLPAGIADTGEVEIEFHSVEAPQNV